MRIGPAANVARINVDEIITAFWTIGGVGLRNTAIDLLGLGSPANRILGSDVDGDAEERFRLHAGGIMQWGDGAVARDTNLFRSAAGFLRTDDSFVVGGANILLGNLALSSRDITLTLLNNSDVDSGVVTIQRVTLSGAGTNVTGFAGGSSGRLLIVVNLGGNVMTLTHQDVLSVAANRMILPDAANYRIEVDEQASLFYDFSSLRWRLLGVGSP